MQGRLIKRRITQSLVLGMLLTGCGGGGGGSDSSPAPEAPPAPAESGVVGTSAVDPSGAFASVLRPCTYAGDATERCQLSRLPFIGQEFANPTIDDIMTRVLVSHTWMGDNFRELLTLLPPDTLLMLRSVTAVVIASDIRPAFYDPRTGAIYLDADFLWLTDDERNDVTREQDFRTAFGNSLQVRLPWRYVRNGERLTIRLNPDGSRPASSLVPIMGFLLYHELAHAIDFMSPAKMLTVSDNQTTQQAIASGPRLSDQFVGGLPLNSQLLDDLAGVSFLGNSATESLSAVQPEELVSEFADDGAIQYYSYSTQFEDFATLLETVLMEYQFGFVKDTGITDNPASGSSADGVLVWGQRGRLSANGVYQRALAVMQASYPGDLADIERFLADLPGPTQLPEGSTWGDSVEAIGGTVNSASTEANGVSRLVLGEEDDILARRAIR